MAGALKREADLVAAAAGAAGDQPEAVAALQNALSGLGEAYVAFGRAILAIDVTKAAAAGPAAGEAGKKKKPAKDKADKEKRKPTAYNLFVKAESGNLRKADNQATQQEIMRNLGTMWRELPSHEKDKYTARAQGTEIPATPGAGGSDDEDVGSKRARSDKKKADSDKKKADFSDDDAAGERSEKKKKKKKKKKKEKEKQKDSSSSSSDSE